MDKVRIGVIGAGWFASRRHIPTIIESEHAELVALCRRDEWQLAKVANHFGVERTFTDYREMLDDVEMDGVLIATPHVLHHEHAEACLLRGLHVLVEKPMTVSSASAHELVRIADKEKRVIVVGLNPPYWTHCRYLKSLIDGGVLGEIEAVSMSWVGDSRFVFGKAPMPDSSQWVVPPTLFRAVHALSGGGHFIDTGSHLVSEVLWTTGLSALEVTAVMDQKVDMRAAVSIRLENDVPCSISIIGDSGGPRRIHNVYVGSKAVAFVEGQSVRVVEHNGSRRNFTYIPSLPEDPVSMSLLQPVDDFVNAIRTGDAPFSSGIDGLRVVEIVEAAYLSAHRSGSIGQLLQR